MNAKNSVKMLQRVGIALIALPDPISTPIGIAFVVAARFISKRLEVIFNKRLTGTIRNYLSTSRPIADITAESNKEKNAAQKKESDKRLPVSTKAKGAEQPSKLQDSSPASNVITFRTKEPDRRMEAAPNTTEPRQKPPNKRAKQSIPPEQTEKQALKTLPSTAKNSAGKMANEKMTTRPTDSEVIANRYGIKPKASTKVNRGIQENEEESPLNLKIDRQKMSRIFSDNSSDSGSGKKDISGKVKLARRNTKNETTEAKDISEKNVSPPRVMDAAALRRRYGISALGQRNHK